MSRIKMIAISAAMPLMAMGATKTYEIDIENPLSSLRTDVPIVIDIANLSPGFICSQAIVSGEAGEIPSQIDDLNLDGTPDQIAFVTDIPSNGKIRLSLTISDTGTQPAYPPRVWAGYKLRGPKKDKYSDVIEVTVPGHTDFYNNVMGHGPMFESELVGYRVYFNQKQTLDPYGKFNKGLELEECLFYPNDEQLARGFGDDVLLAGNSSGIGAFKGWDGKKATHIEPVKSRTERLVASGPVRTIVEVAVDDWDYQGKPIDMLNRYTLYAGHRDLQIDVEFDQPLSDQTFSAGVERIMGTETESYNDKNGLIAAWGRHWPVNDTIKYAKETIGIATYVPRQYVKGQADTPDDFMYIVQAPGQKSLTYHTMFTSKKEQFGFADSKSWFGYLPKWKEELDNPVKVSIKEK